MSPPELEVIKLVTGGIGSDSGISENHLLAHMLQELKEDAGDLSEEPSKSSSKPIKANQLRLTMSQRGLGKLFWEHVCAHV
jgi:hypothetical protein